MKLEMFLESSKNHVWKLHTDFNFPELSDTSIEFLIPSKNVNTLTKIRGIPINASEGLLTFFHNAFKSAKYKSFIYLTELYQWKQNASTFKVNNSSITHLEYGKDLVSLIDKLIEYVESHEICMFCVRLCYCLVD